MSNEYALGIDFGTSSCRALVIDLADGSEIATSEYLYEHGANGVVRDGRPGVARQHPADYIRGLECSMTDVVAAAAAATPAFKPESVVAVGAATTGSTPVPIAADGQALALHDGFADDLDAMAWLWMDHSSQLEAEQITRVAAAHRPAYVNACGGTYSAEWFWAKIWHCQTVAHETFAAAHSWAELSDYITGLLVGAGAPEAIPRCITAASHKAMYADDWGGLPDAEFLSMLDPGLAELRSRLYDVAQPPTAHAGGLSERLSQLTGIPAGTAVSHGTMDSHAGGVAGGVRHGVFASVIGTSTCDVTIFPLADDAPLPMVDDVCGVTRSSIMEQHATIEAGQSAVGDGFTWFAQLVGQGASTAQVLAELGKEASALPAGAHGLLAMDWLNGSRSVPVDHRLSGVIAGMTTNTRPAEILRALVEATAFGARLIVERVDCAADVRHEFVALGGIPHHGPWIAQVYADVLGRPVTVAATSHGSALGAAVNGAVAAGRFPGVLEAQQVLLRPPLRVMEPQPGEAATYERLYQLFVRVRNALSADGALAGVMAELRDVSALSSKSSTTTDSQEN